MNVITTTGTCSNDEEDVIEYGSAVGAAIGRPFGETAEEVGAGVGSVTAALLKTPALSEN